MFPSRGAYFSNSSEEIYTLAKKANISFSQAGVNISQKIYTPAKRANISFSQAGVYISQKEIYTPSSRKRIFAHLRLTGFSALQVAAGGWVGRQGLDLVEFDKIENILKNGKE